MKSQVDRAEVLLALESVSPGLAAKELLQQSTSFVFDSGNVVTFNDEISCIRKNPFPGTLTGAVRAAPLLELLNKMTDDSLLAETNGSELILSGAGKRAKFRMESDVLLPLDSVEDATDWYDLPESFDEAVGLVHACASSEESLFVLTCVHLAPEFIEACDRFQMARYSLDLEWLPEAMSKIPGQEDQVDTMIRADSLKRVIGLGMTKASVSEGWMHFKNNQGLKVSVRRHLDSYSDISKYLHGEDTSPVAMPGGLDEIVERARIFSQEKADANNLMVILREDTIVIKGEGASGEYAEKRKVSYKDKPIRFLIAPSLLVEISKRSTQCGVGGNRLFVDAGNLKYAASTCCVEE